MIGRLKGERKDRNRDYLELFLGINERDQIHCTDVGTYVEIQCKLCVLFLYGKTGSPTRRSVQPTIVQSIQPTQRTKQIAGINWLDIALRTSSSHCLQRNCHDRHADLPDELMPHKSLQPSHSRTMRLHMHQSPISTSLQMLLLLRCYTRRILAGR
jgi:hypothetical protein